MLEVTEVTDVASHLTSMGKLRVRAWRARHGDLFQRDLESWTDEHDHHACHFAVVVGATLVASARVCVHGAPDELPFARSCDNHLRSLPVPVASITASSWTAATPGSACRGCSTTRASRARALGARCVIATTSREHRRDALAARGFRHLGRATLADPTPLRDIIRAYGEDILALDL